VGCGFYAHETPTASIQAPNSAVNTDRKQNQESVIPILGLGTLRINMSEEIEQVIFFLFTRIHFPVILNITITSFNQAQEGALFQYSLRTRRKYYSMERR